MAAIYFTNNSDSGDGSLRAALASASAGDTIAPDPNVAWNGDIEIALESVLPSKSINIVGTPTQRIIFNGQGNTRFYNVSTSLNMEFRYVDFKNGYRSDAAPFYISRLDSGDSWTFESCRFYGGHGTYSGAVQIASSSTGTVGQFTFNNCVAFNNESTGTYNSGVSCPVFLYVANASTATVVISNCTLGKGTDRDSVGGLGGTVTKTNSLIDGENSVAFANVGFVDPTNCDFRLTATSPYLTGGSSTGTDYLGHARSGSIGAYDGSWFVVSTSGTATVSSNTEVDYLDIGASATVTFSGTDRILAGTKGATIGAATLQAASDSNGYLAIPGGASTSSATFTGVKAAIYGAGASSLSSTTTGANAATLTWNQTNSGVPVLLELQDGSDWTTVSTSATSPASVTATPIAGKTYRIFDGENFATVTVTAQGFVFARQYQVISGSIGSFSATEQEWETITQLVGVNDSMNEEVRRGQAVTLLARIYDAFDNDSPLLNNGTNISSVYYTCEKTGKGLYQKTYMPVVGHNNVSAGADCVLSSLTTDDAWEADSTGYNFVLTPDIRQNTLFDEEGQYRFKVTVNLASGNPIVFYHSVTVAK